MTTFAEIFEKKGINVKDFEDKAIDQEAINIDLQIEFASKWLKLLERNASAKEKFLFARDNGFVSEHHLNLWMTVQDDADLAKEEFELYKDSLSEEEFDLMQKDVREKQLTADTIKSPVHYRLAMRRLGIKDYSPYGEDLIGRKNLF